MRLFKDEYGQLITEKMLEQEFALWLLKALKVIIWFMVK